MAVTLRDVLASETLAGAGASVLAGRDRLDRPVRWVHVAELPDIAHLLSGGELLLTTGIGIGETAALQRRYVRELAGAGVAGLVVELGRRFAELPRAMVDEAERRGLPLVALERETRYVELTETVHRAIISHQHELLSRAERVSRQLTELILSGADVGRVVQELGSIFGCTVVLEDAARRVVEVAPGGGTGGALEEWEAHSAHGHEEAALGGVQEAAGDERCLFVGIWLRHQPWGRLHVLPAEGALDEIAELLVDRAGAALGLALLSDRDAAHLADRAGSALVGDLLAGRLASGGELMRRARSLGVDLGRGRLAAVALESTGGDERSTRRAVTEEDRLTARLALADDLRRAAAERGCPALVGLDGDRVLGLVAIPGRRPAAVVLEAVVAAAAERTAARDPALELVAGASGELDGDSLRQGLDEAVSALAFGRRRGDRGRLLHHFGELGAYQLLLPLAHGPELARFVDTELRPLLAHDTGRKAKLLPTLEAYLAHAGRKSETIRALGIQRRTLYARLDRIAAILRQDLDDQDTRTRLSLALQAMDLLESLGDRRGAGETDPVAASR
ncbi:MAG TPA: PucR family transcriptional regulator [Acidimicrobiales bacterium]|nr:PucR family transcriptional regulator [Acidimicrobiales bacterium]